MSGNEPIIGIGQAALNSDYRKKLSEDAQLYLGKNDSISADKVRNMPLFGERYQNLSTEKQAQIDRIFNLDGDAGNVSKNEMQTLLLFLDAELNIVDGKERFVLDGGRNSISDNNGIFQSTDEEIQNIYKKIKEDSDNEIMINNSSRILNEAGFTANIDVSKYSTMSENIDNNVFPKENTTQIKADLNAAGIEFQENDDGSLTYEIGEKRYRVYVATEEYSTYSGVQSDRFVHTDVMDLNGKKLQTVWTSGLRDSSNGIHVANYDENGNNITDVAEYDSYENELQAVTEYYYDKNGNLIQSQDVVGSRRYFTKYENGEEIEWFRTTSGKLSRHWDKANGEIRYSDKDLLK